MSTSADDLTFPATLRFPGGSATLRDAGSIVLTSELNTTPQWQLVLFNWLLESGRAVAEHGDDGADVPLIFQDPAEAAAVFMLAGWVAHAPESAMQRLGTVIFGEHGLSHHPSSPVAVIPELGIFSREQSDAPGELFAAPYFPHPAATAPNVWVLLHERDRSEKDRNERDWPSLDSEFASNTLGSVRWAAYSSRPEFPKVPIKTVPPNEPEESTAQANSVAADEVPEDTGAIEPELSARLTKMELEVREELRETPPKSADAQRSGTPKRSDEPERQAHHATHVAPADPQNDIGVTLDRLSRLVDALPDFDAKRRIALSLVCDQSDARRATSIVRALGVEGEHLRMTDGRLNIIVTVADRQQARALLASFSAVQSGRLKNAALAG